MVQRPKIKKRNVEEEEGIMDKIQVEVQGGIKESREREVMGYKFILLFFIL